MQVFTLKMNTVKNFVKILTVTHGAKNNDCVSLSPWCSQLCRSESPDRKEV